MDLRKVSIWVAEPRDVAMTGISRIPPTPLGSLDGRDKQGAASTDRRNTVRRQAARHYYSLKRRL